MVLGSSSKIGICCHKPFHLWKFLEDDQILNPKIPKIESASSKIGQISKKRPLMKIDVKNLSKRPKNQNSKISEPFIFCPMKFLSSKKREIVLCYLFLLFFCLIPIMRKMKMIKKKSLIQHIILSFSFFSSTKTQRFIR